jgi:hypothetical protein
MKDKKVGIVPIWVYAVVVALGLVGVVLTTLHHR